MICKNCGMPLPNGTLNCPNCGSGQVSGNVGAGGGGYTATTPGGNYGDVMPGSGGRGVDSGGGQGHNFGIGEAQVQIPAGNMSGGQDIKPVDDDEKIIYIIKQKTGLLDAIFNAKVFKMNFDVGMITNKRVYYTGKSYYRKGKSVSRLYEKRIVDLEDITSTGFCRITYFFCLILSIIWFISAICFFLAAVVEVNRWYVDSVDFLNVMLWSEYTWLGIYSAIFFLICFLCFILTIKNLYEITFASGSIVIRVPRFGSGMADMAQFDEVLRKERDKYLKYKGDKKYYDL